MLYTKRRSRPRKKKRTYIGLRSLEFKKRVSLHKTDFAYKKYKESTKLSNYIWNLKENNIKYELKWEILKKTKQIRNGDIMCRLCTQEIRSILKNHDAPLNSRNEMMGKCRHKKQFLLKNWKKKKEKDDKS